MSGRFGLRLIALSPIGSDRGVRFLPHFAPPPLDWDWTWLSSDLRFCPAGVGGSEASGTGGSGGGGAGRGRGRGTEGPHQRETDWRKLARNRVKNRDRKKMLDSIKDQT